MPNAISDLIKQSSANAKPLSLNKPVGLITVESGLSELLQDAAGGFTAFDHALCVYAGQANTGNGIFDIEYWNTKAGWKTFYGDMLDDVVFFAEDVFGSQFGLVEDQVVVRFEPETAELTVHSESLNDWAMLMLTDNAFETGSGLAAQWSLENGPIPAGHRLLPLIPFSVGGEYTISNLEAVAKKPAMQKYAWLAQRLLETEDGGEVDLTGW